MSAESQYNYSEMEIDDEGQWRKVCLMRKSCNNLENQGKNPLCHNKKCPSTKTLTA